ncbi:S9 family peptidase [Chitinophaga tropicalis]|uniref:Prolyl oligopeptidase family serine peptidase n=1 Tax=Chitinophaga tropicalis TaxID=2683588 RepID=A0A7K1U7M4_9BACT|nr:DPP IV N-terminal domain-containing protein [Chitinophaga tropicalis]MVT10342.1 prolyl oligopeptidase family serine peptidase [Chitinophaga tropicalis]
MLRHTFNILLTTLCLVPVGLSAQQQTDPAGYFDAPNLAKQVGSLTVVPFFIKDTDKFWFSASDSAENDYYLVDPTNGTRRVISDRVFLAARLYELRKEKIDTSAIRVSMPGVSRREGMQVIYRESRYKYDLVSGKLTENKQDEKKYADWRTGLSPDRKWQLVSKGHNLYLRRLRDSAETKLSADGELWYSFNLNDDDTSLTRESSTDAVWIKGTAQFYVIRKDRRRIGTMSVLHTLYPPRPRIETYKYELPGDKEVTQYELFVGDAEKGTFTRINTNRWKDQELEVLYGGSKVYFVRKKRTRDEMELCSVSLQDTAVKVLIHEVSRPYINEDLFAAAILNDGEDILWWSDRSGWGHYYLYNGNGQLKKQLTAGEWTAGKVAKIDTVARKLYFYGYGRQKDINPYYAFLYSVDLQGRDLRLLTPENATHHVFIDPQGKYFVDNYSRIDLEPRTIVRSTSGRMVMEVWKPDISRLYRYGWKKPEMFRIKAADGVTDLYGIMWKPFNFDSAHRYPVISQVYPGPQTETVWSEFTILDRYNNTALAQTGCIVVCMGHRGGSPYRSKAYHTYGYGQLRDYALADDKYGLQQLAARYPFIDTTRIGIFGHSGGGMMAVTALCTYPDFYKVAVASSGNHDNYIYNRTWGETFQGIQQKDDSTFSFSVPLNQELAGRLKGHLLLVTGEVDANVHPGNTYRMVNALIQAGKDFDMLVLPGQSHTYEGKHKEYFQQRLRNYFKQYFIGIF